MIKVYLYRLIVFLSLGIFVVMLILFCYLYTAIYIPNKFLIYVDESYESFFNSKGGVIICFIVAFFLLILGLILGPFSILIMKLIKKIRKRSKFRFKYPKKKFIRNSIKIVELNSKITI